MKTYLIRLVLSVAALLSASTAHAAYVFFALNEDDVIIYYSILSTQERTCRVSNGGPSCYSGVVRIPEKVSCNSVEFQVVGIEDNAFSMCYDLTSVEIPKTVTTIGQGAFSNCRRLTSVTIPSGVSMICASAFSGCTRWCHLYSSVCFRRLHRPDLYDDSRQCHQYRLLCFQGLHRPDQRDYRQVGTGNV